jgi:CRISPR system Cascade subunit CasE
MTLSARPPADPHGLFDLDCKEFAPVLSVGDRLGFRLRANPTVTRSCGAGKRGQRADVVMDALRGAGDRAAQRPGTIVTAGRAWLAAQGARHGFTPDPEVAVDGYDQRRLPRPGGTPMQFSTLDFEGRLTIDDPALFLAQLARGFGRAKAFGCGLMLIRRAG